MHLNNGTGSVIVLIGVLDDCGALEMDDYGDFYLQATLILHDHIQSHVIHKYSVFIEGDSALRVKQYGFHGLRLWIEGCFKIENSIQKIVADKVTFLDCKDPDVFQFSENVGLIRLNDEKKTLEIVLHQADKTGMLTPARIGNWENGTRSPGLEEAVILAEVLSVAASYLLCLSDDERGEIAIRESHYIDPDLSGVHYNLSQFVFFRSNICYIFRILQYPALPLHELTEAVSNIQGY